MSTDPLLDNIRKINRVFLDYEEESPSLEQCIQALSEVIDASLILYDQTGRLLGGSIIGADSSKWFASLLKQESLGEDAPEKELLELSQAKANQGLSELLPDLEPEKSFITVEPLNGGGRQLGVLLAKAPKNKLENNSLALVGVGAALLTMHLLQVELYDRQEEERNKALATVAFESLSYSEVEAIQEVLKKVKNNESVIVASKIADSLGITRSVIVNALRKFESAGIIESRSLGMKGTFIRVKNMKALDEIASQTSRVHGMR